MLRTARVVTLVGPGGVGKTRLATRLAHQVRRVFRDGVVWIDLAAYHEPASLMSEVASALGVEPQGQPVGEAVTAYLSSRELLLVLDNCEHLVDACAHLVAELLQEADGLRVLTTSREALRIDGEYLMRVEPLAVPSPEESAAGAIGQVDAVVLLTERARSVHPDFKVDAANVEAAARLCRRLDGIPLAIELAAARLRVLVPRTDRRPPRRAVRPADGRSPRSPPPASDPARNGGVEPRAVLAGRAGSVGPVVGVRRRRRPRRGRGSVW